MLPLICEVFYAPNILKYFVTPQYTEVFFFCSLNILEICLGYFNTFEVSLCSLNILKYFLLS